MPEAKKMRKVSLAFVDLDGDSIPEPRKSYRLVDAGSQVVGNVPAPATELKLLTLQLLSMYVEDLPDFSNRNEGLLRLGAHTRSQENTANKEELAYSVEFTVRDRRYAPGFLQRVVFRNVLFRRFVELRLNLVELDKNLADVYGKVAGVVEDAGLSAIDAINSIPYIKVATKLFDGLIRTFGKNADDLVWSETPTLDVKPGAGGAFLRSGIYVLYESKSLFRSRAGRKRKPGVTIPIKNLRYRNGVIRHNDDADFPLSNHLVFNIQVDPTDE